MERSPKRRRRAAGKTEDVKSEDAKAEAVYSNLQQGASGGATDEHRQEERSPEVLSKNVSEIGKVADGNELLASNASGESRRIHKRGRKRKVVGVTATEAHLSESDRAWIESLSGPRLDLIVGLKKLGMRRLETAGSDGYAGVLGPRALRVMGIVLEEFIKDQLKKVERTMP